MMLWLTLVIQGATGIRCASRVMSLFYSSFQISLPSPSWFTGRWWLMKLGYYKLTCPKEKSTDWVWIIDHSIQMGPEKCLLILGIQLKNLPKDRALTAADLEPIELIPVKKSNGDIVRSEEHTSELQSLMRISYAVFCLKKKNTT